MIPLYPLYIAHLEWLGTRSMLKGVEKSEFVRWLCRAHPELASRKTDELTLLRQQCREVQRGTALPRQPCQLNLAKLKRYAAELTARYLAEPDPRPSFAEFLERVLRECPTENALQHFLGTTSAAPTS